MTNAATLRRSATLLGATLTALALTGPAWGQTVLDGVGSTVEATTETVQPVTDAVDEAATQATAPVRASQPAQTSSEGSGGAVPVVDQAAQSVGSTTGAATETVQAATGAAVEAATGAVDSGTKTVTRTAEAVTTRAARTVAPLAEGSVGTLTRTIEKTTSSLPSSTQTLLGPLVDTIDARAEELLGSTRIPALADAGEAPPTGWMPATGETSAEPTPAGDPSRARGARPGPSGGVPDRLPPSSGWPAGQSGAAPAGQARDPGPVPGPDRSGAPAAPFSAGGTGPGFSAALAVLAGLLAFALAASLGRRMPWSDLVRPLAFVSPPDRPG